MVGAGEHQDRTIAKTRVREAVGVVQSRDQLEKLVEKLLTTGFDRSAIDLMTSQDVAARQLGAMHSKPIGTTEAPDLARRELVLPSDKLGSTALVFGTLISIGALAGAMPIVASGGALAAAAVAALGGGAVGSGIAKLFKDRIVEQSDSIDLENELRADGIVVLVRLRDRAHEEKALAVMKGCGAEKVHVHEVEISKGLDDVPLANITPDPLLDQERLGG